MTPCPAAAPNSSVRTKSPKKSKADFSGDFLSDCRSKTGASAFLGMKRALETPQAKRGGSRRSPRKASDWSERERVQAPIPPRGKQIPAAERNDYHFTDCNLHKIIHFTHALFQTELSEDSTKYEYFRGRTVFYSLFGRKTTTAVCFCP